MPSSLSAAEVQQTIQAAQQAAGTPGGLHPSPADWRDQIIYFLLVDRFDNPRQQPLHQPFDDPNFYSLQGGSFDGVQAQLAYIKQLGAGAIWLAPVLKNLHWDPSTCYHGYGIHDFLSAQPLFAANPANADNELRALVDAAHQHGLLVIFDIVLNHVGDVFAYQGGGAQAAFQPAPMPVQWRDATGNANPAWAAVEAIPPVRPTDALVWPSELQFNAYFRRQGNPAPGGDDTIGDFASLKQMRTDDPNLQNALIAAYQYVIARYDVDGFRIDTLRYLKGDLPRLFGNAMREFALSVGKENFFTFGEVLDQTAEQDIAKFIGRNTQDPTLPQFVGVDAALDYPLFNALKPVVKGFAPPSAVTNMYQQRQTIEADILSSHGDATRYFVTFLDNHDMKERIRYVDPTDATRYDDQVTMGIACLYSLPGVPCLYYGTEQGLHGYGSDPAVREALWGGPGFDPASAFYKALAAIASVRASVPALRYGRFYMRPISGDGRSFGISQFTGGVLAFSRILSNSEIVVAANTNTTSQLPVWVIVDSQLTQVNGATQLLYSNKQAPAAPGTVQPQNNTVVQEPDGTMSSGALHAVQVNLQPLEAQVIRVA
jgi:glycosidase